MAKSFFLRLKLKVLLKLSSVDKNITCMVSKDQERHFYTIGYLVSIAAFNKSYCLDS